MFCVFVYIILHLVRLQSLPLCSRNGDTLGNWLPINVYDQSTTVQNHVKERFIFGGPGEAQEFNHIWVPDHCSYHRYTAVTLGKIADIVKDKTRNPYPVNLLVIGDSGTRGLLCGITRILSGSETYGPCENVICGTEKELAMSFEKTNMKETVQLDQSFNISLIYIKSLLDQRTREVIKESISNKPYAVVLNTGAWDFKNISDLHQKEVASDFCDTAEMENVSISRAAPEIHTMLHETGRQAHALGVRAIYRTNHHNGRFGSHCADDRVLTALQGSGWEVWDNRRVSHSIWKHQIHDGFHYDRDYVHSVRQHRYHRHEQLSMGRGTPGMLEMQLTQSLLHLLFRDTLQELIDEGFEL